MKFKSAAQRSAVILVILLFSMFIGYIYQSLGHKMDLAKHPRKYSTYVTQYCAEYGVPEYIVYGLILTESDFQSNHVSEDGEIGLMQLSPEIFQWMLSMTKENLDVGILYDPETNIRYGTYLLSHWFTEYSRWNTVLAMYLSDEETVGAWLTNPACTDDNGNLAVIPDTLTAEAVEQVEQAVETYRKLYYDYQN